MKPVGLSTIPMYRYDCILYGCMMGTDHMLIPHESVQDGTALQVWSEDHSVLLQVKCKGVAGPPAHGFDHVEWYPMQEVLQGATNTNT